MINKNSIRILAPFFVYILIRQLTLCADRPCLKGGKKLHSYLTQKLAENSPFSVQFLRSSCLLNFTLASGKKKPLGRSLAKLAFLQRVTDQVDFLSKPLVFFSVESQLGQIKACNELLGIGCKFPFPFCQLFGNSENLEISQRTF